MSRFSIQKGQQLFPILIFNLIFSFFEKFFVNEVAIDSKQLRTDIRQSMRSIVCILFCRHYYCVLDHVPNELMLIFVKTKCKGNSTNLAVWGFDF